MISDSITGLVVIARSDSDEAIHSVRAARWIVSRSLSSGRAFARTRWLAMTTWDDAASIFETRAPQ
jgi:hypothetical protein